MKLHGISGSLRVASINARLLAAARQLVPKNVEFAVEDTISNLPLFNPENSVSSDHELTAFVDRIRACDGVIFSSPVYAGGYPGALKNALDWLVGTDGFYQKPFMMLSASNRMPQVEATLIAVLETMGGVHVSAASTTIQLIGGTLSVSEIVADDESSNAIRQSLDRFVSSISTQS